MYLMFGKLNLNKKEMAALLGISIEAVTNLKCRVKQKVGEEDLKRIEDARLEVG
jgi:DNA-binding CsgD family transcriptional regulator